MASPTPPHSTSSSPTPKIHTDAQKSKERILIENLRDLTPLNEPLFPFSKASSRTPSQYLNSQQTPFGEKVAKWQRTFFNLPNLPTYGITPAIPPIRSTSPTIITLFYYSSTETRRPLQVYLERIKILARMNEQTIFYVPPSLQKVIKEMRTDDHWHIISDYETIWDMPPNTYQFENFTVTQPLIFETFDGYSEKNDWTPNPQYNKAHLSATYNAKAFVTYDAVMRNPFGSDRWMFVDAGFWDEIAPLYSQGIQWGKVIQERLDEDKFDRSISITRDTGVVFGEYMQSEEYGVLDVNHECWDDPKKAWLVSHFIAHCHVGNSLGMLNYAVRYMQTVDDLDANGRYSGREEFVVSWVALRYPNTVFSIPWTRTPGLRVKWEYPTKSCFTTYGGKATVPAIVDPLSTIICKGYKPRHPNLEGQGLYAKTWKQTFEVEFKKWVFTSGYRGAIENLMRVLGFNDL